MDQTVKGLNQQLFKEAKKHIGYMDYLAKWTTL